MRNDPAEYAKKGVMAMDRILEEKLRTAAKSGHLSHAIIFSGNGNRVEAARYAAAAMECQNERDKPCRACRACHKVLSAIHPDVMLVHDNERKTIPVDDLRALRADAYIRPNEGNRKVYIFDDCSQLSEAGQNVLLKIIEEGPPYAAFFFCTESSAALLPTVRSRCIEFKLNGPREETDYSQAEAFCRLLKRRGHAEAAAFLMGLEVNKVTRDEVFALLAASRDLLTAALSALYGKAPAAEFRSTVAEITENLTKKQIICTIEMLEKYSAQSRFNVGVGHLAGALAAELEAILD